MRDIVNGLSQPVPGSQIERTARSLERERESKTRGIWWEKEAVTGKAALSLPSPHAFFALVFSTALFTVNFSYLHKNVFERGCHTMLGKNCKIVGNCLTSTSKDIVLRKSSCKKDYSRFFHHLGAWDRPVLSKKVSLGRGEAYRFRSLPMRCVR